MVQEWIRCATTRPVVRRAMASAGVVGIILIAINQGDAVLRGDFSGGRLLRMLLTLLVPYCVSTYSSVQAIRRPTSTPSRSDGTQAPVVHS